MRYESPSSEESIGTVATQYRAASERGRKQKELEENVAKIGDQSDSVQHRCSCGKEAKLKQGRDLGMMSF